jgi:hypothetical protein
LAWALLAALAAACSFDPSGVGGAGADAGPGPPDAAAGGPDAAAGAPDGPAGPDAPPGTPDATPPPADAMAPPADAAAPDSDGDGVVDAVDNCPLVANPGQQDEDGDGDGNVCDNCPSIANATQANTGETGAGNPADGVGDACDPRPTLGGDAIAFFDGFDAANPAWIVGSGTSTWGISGGVMRQTDTEAASGDVRLLYLSGVTFGNAVVESTIKIDAFASTILTPYRTVGVVASYDDGGSSDTGYTCAQFRDTGGGGDNNVLMHIDGAATVLANAGLPWTMNTTNRVRARLYTRGTGDDQRCTLQNLTTPAEVTTAGTDPDWNGSHVGLRTYRIAASFEYVVVYALGAPL